MYVGDSAAFANPIDACGDPDLVAGDVVIQTGVGDRALLVSIPQTTITVRVAGATGALGALDNIRLIDVTPQLDVEFEPSESEAGETVALTLTVTNSSDLAAKPGWSFAATLPDGLTVAPDTDATTTCANGTVAAEGGSASIAVAGDLEADDALCEITVLVTAAAGGEYAVDAVSIADAVGVRLPGSTTLTVAAPPEPTVPEETVPEETIPEETVPEETVAEETVPEETVLEPGIIQLTVPGMPGTPQPYEVLFRENFETVADGTFVMLPSYVGASGTTYTAAPIWVNAAACNGIVTSFNSPNTPACTSSASVRAQTQAIGAMNGSVDPNANHAVSAYTALPNPGANLVEFETTSPLAISVENRFISFSVNVAVSSCQANHPLLRFYLLDGATEIPVTGAALDPCTLGNPWGGATTARGTLIANAPILFTGTGVGIRMRNAQGSASGNDHAFDDITILDLTPQLDKGFEVSETAIGDAVTLTFTITNTSDLLAKPGWSFTDTLPAGLVVASPNGFSTTCPSGAVTAPAGGTTIDVSGNLGAGQASCTVSVDVTSTTVGTYENCPDTNVTDLVGLNPPACASVTFLPTDFGDAPDSFATLLASNGARHGVDADLTLGATSDAETDGVPGATAAGDDTAGSDDEDGVADAIVASSDATTTITVTATNDTSAPATLAGWIDLNRNGTFETAERQTIAVPASSGTEDYDLTFPIASSAGATSARFRLFPGTVVDPPAIGAGTTGEVEDYPATISALTPLVCTTSTAYIVTGSPVQLYGMAVGAGATTFSPIGATGAITNLNALAHNPVDGYLYGISVDAATIGQVVRISPLTGVQTVLGPTTPAIPNAALGIDVGAFTPAGAYLVARSTVTPTAITSINVDTLVATSIAVTGVPAAPGGFRVSDWTYANGFVWGITGPIGGAYQNRILRVPVAGGAASNFAYPAGMAAVGAGGAFAYRTGTSGSSTPESCTGSA